MTDEQFTTIMSALASLRESIDNLYDIVDSLAQPPAPALPSAPARCAATTKAGNPCSVAPVSGTSYCMYHQRR